MSTDFMIPKRIGKEVLRAEKWMALSKVTYQDRRGKTRFWDMAERTTRASSAGVDAVAIFTLVKGQNGATSTILVKQYRPALDCYTLECPAGLIDEGEKAEEAAVRELREETGLAGVVAHSSPGIFNDPGTSASCYRYVTLNVDMALEANQNAKPEADEDTEVLSVPLTELKQYLDSATLADPVGGHPRTVVDAGLYSFAMGFDFARNIHQ